MVKAIALVRDNLDKGLPPDYAGVADRANVPRSTLYDRVKANQTTGND